ncbi:MAG: hypothetical protein E4H03_12840, partial [Myxococcales bacterium]
MISLVAKEELSAFGVEALLEVEKIPYRRAATLAAAAGDAVIVAGGDLDAREIAACASRPTIVLGGGSATARAFSTDSDVLTCRGPVEISLAGVLWPARVVDVAASAGESCLRLPDAAFIASEESSLADDRRSADILAWMTAVGSDAASRTRFPAVVSRERLVWVAVDLGQAFATLLGESYCSRAPEHHKPSAVRLALSALKHRAYYALPDRLRVLMRERIYRLLSAGPQPQQPWASQYPIDASGWLIGELLKSLLRRVTDAPTVRLARWPAPFTSAAAVTHDLEPTRYAYTVGLGRLLDRPMAATQAGGTYGVVADAAKRYSAGELRRRLTGRSVLCHGLSHDGESSYSELTHVRGCVNTARRRLESNLGRRVRGYRSPRLDRSPELARALDESGFVYDSSWPDVDRENVDRFGAGVRVNHPFRPPVAVGGGKPHPSRCLELPLTAPDCIQPLFMGESEQALRDTVSKKAAYIRDTEGMYVALVHAGVFGDDDADVRMRHLSFVEEVLCDAGVWLADMDMLADWWTRREAVRLESRGDT